MPDPKARAPNQNKDLTIRQIKMPKSKAAKLKGMAEHKMSGTGTSSSMADDASVAQTPHCSTKPCHKKVEGTELPNDENWGQIHGRVGAMPMMPMTVKTWPLVKKSKETIWQYQDSN